jgi:hypothetical protein
MANQDRPSREVIAFAFVADAFTRTNDALRGLAPIFESAIAKRNGALFDAASIASEVNAQFDLEVSPLVVEGLVPALVEEGLLHKVVGTSEQVLYRCVRRSATECDTATGVEVESIFAKFRSFAAPLLTSHGIEFAQGDLDRKLLDVISTTDFLYVALRNDQSRYRGRTLALKKQEVIDVNDVSRQALDTLAAQFVNQCLESEPKEFELLVKAAWGALIAEVVLSLQHPGKQDVSKLTIFLDGPLILDFLDVGSEEGHAYAKDLFDLLHKSGAKLATFGHVVEEMVGAISTPLQRMALNEPVSGPLVRRLQHDPRHLTHVRTVLSTLTSILQSENISVFDDSKFETHDLVGFFNNEEINSLRNSIGEPHFNLDRRERDAKSVAFVTRLRKGIAPASVSEAEAVFVTRNVVLAKEAEKQLQRTKRSSAFAAPVCVTDRQLAGVLWFCCGGGGQALTQLKLVANCAQAVVPRTDLVSNVAQILFDTNPGRRPEFEALLRDKRAAMCLMRETVGVASFATAENAEKLLNDMRAELTAEAEQAYAVNLRAELARADAQRQADIERERSAAEQKLEDERNRYLKLEGRLAEATESHRRYTQQSSEETFRLTKRLDQAQSDLGQLRTKVDKESRDRADRDELRRLKVSRFANGASLVVEILVALVVCLGVLYGVFASIRGTKLASFGWLAVTVYVVVTILLVVAAWFGVSRAHLRTFIAKRIEIILLP